MIIIPANSDHLGAWSHLRSALWPDALPAEHQHDIERTFLHGGPSAAAFVAVVKGEVVGFAEASLRHDYVNGCKSSPVAFLEGIFVAPTIRRRGIARALCEAVEEWGRGAGCLEFASDTSPENEASQQLHLSLGFEETQRVVFYRKRLNG